MTLPTDDILNGILTTCIRQPANSYQDIANRVTRYWYNRYSQETVSADDIKNALTHLRKMSVSDPTAYGWTIPHCRRGRDNNTPRLFILLVNRNGDYFTIDDERPPMLKEGQLGMLRGMASQFATQEKSYEIAARYTRSPARKRYYRGMARKAAFMAEETRDILEEVEEAAA